MARSGDNASLTERWAGFAADLTYDDLPESLVPVLKGLMLDTIGVSLAASTVGPCCGDLIDVARNQGGTGNCLALGFGDRLPLLMAGLVNGTLAHALNFDASGAAGGHIGVATVPAPLAAAQASGEEVSGKHFLTALAVAAEMTTRLAASLNDTGVDIHEKFLEGQILGVFGASAGAGKIRGLDARRLHDVLGLALMQASGTRQVSFEGGAAKVMSGGFSNHAALLATELAAQGIGARCRAFEGEAGLYALFYGGRYQAGVMEDGLGETFLSQETVFKPWPTSGVVHPFIAASLQLRARHQFDPRSLKRVKVIAGEASRAWLEPESLRICPTNAATAANSIFFGVLTALARGDVTLRDMSDAALAEPPHIALAWEIAHEIEPALGRAARIEVETADGTVLSASHDGTPPRLGFDRLAEKFRACAELAARPPSTSAVEEFIEKVHEVDKLSDICQAISLLSAEI